MGTFAAVITVVLLSSYVIGVFVFDFVRRKKGKPSIFLDACESEGHGKRLIRQYRRKYGFKSK